MWLCLFRLLLLDLSEAWLLTRSVAALAGERRGRLFTQFGSMRASSAVRTWKEAYSVCDVFGCRVICVIAVKLDI